MSNSYKHNIYFTFFHEDVRNFDYKKVVFTVFSKKRPLVNKSLGEF